MQGDHETQRNIENIKSTVNRKYNGIVGSRRAVANRVGVAVSNGLEMRSTGRRPRTTAGNIQC